MASHTPVRRSWLQMQPVAVAQAGLLVDSMSLAALVDFFPC